MRGFILSTLQQQIELGLSTDMVICLGEGKNMKFLARLNKEQKLFREIIPLPHPRWVMQYRYKSRHEYIRKYLGVLQ